MVILTFDLLGEKAVAVDNQYMFTLLKILDSFFACCNISLQLLLFLCGKKKIISIMELVSCIAASLTRMFACDLSSFLQSCTAILLLSTRKAFNGFSQSRYFWSDIGFQGIQVWQAGKWVVAGLHAIEKDNHRLGARFCNKSSLQ